MKRYHINEYKTLSKLLKKNKNLLFSNKIVKYLYEDLVTLSNHINTNVEANIACKKGCSYCCNSRVEISQPEAMFIYTYIKDNLNQEQLESIFNRIKEIVSLTSNIENQNDYNKLQLPCIFLNNNECGIYEIRPFVCREFHSVNLESCERNYVHFEENTGAKKLIKIKDSYYRIFTPYVKLYRENKLEFTSNEFMESLLKIHQDDNYTKKYFDNSK